MFAPPAADPPAAFNLVCTGTDRWYPHKNGVLDLAVSTDQPFTITFRVDLAAKRWCAGKCETTSPIPELYPTEIVFIRDGDPSLSDGQEEWVNRENGAFTYRMRTGALVILELGACTRAPFSSFPSLKF